MDKRRVVVTGIGLVTPLGLDAETNRKNIQSGTLGIGYMTRVQRDDIDIKVAGELKDYNPADYFDSKTIRRTDPVMQYGMIAARETLKNARLSEGDFDPAMAGVIIASGIGGLSTVEKEVENALNRGYNRVSPFFIPLTIANTTASSVAMESGFKGLCTCIITACAAGTNAIGEAFHKIRDGYLDLALTGGAEATLTPMAFGGFASMRALSRSADPALASIPFDRRRDGFVMGEGAGVLLLESLEHAQKRGAAILAEIIGYGASCDAFHMTAPDPSGEQPARSMSLCLEDAGIHPEDVQYINAHGTSTPLNDVMETQAIKNVFGEHAYKLLISSTKSMTGHLLGASGALEAAATIFALRDQFVHPTIGLSEQDPDCDLDYVPGKGRHVDLTYALSNSLGFGGHNASIAFKVWKEA
ncbi:MAG TPA: beta-ketoacyl-ACP synthase II [Clostridiaceae bacterium]|jgi:3-oxoacyl-[acyl-carrier-protein] synthase II|nr:beta-ketoacyl-ACP synthase II [Clostridiaceae bacterium]